MKGEGWGESRMDVLHLKQFPTVLNCKNLTSNFRFGKVQQFDQPQDVFFLLILDLFSVRLCLFLSIEREKTRTRQANHVSSSANHLVIKKN